MARINLHDMFTSFTPSAPAPDLALEASFGLQDIERLLRENKMLLRENKVLRAKLRDISALVSFRSATP